MKPALHRSITFWSGLLVIAFLSWAWWDSGTYLSYTGWQRITAGSVAHGIVIGSEPAASGSWRGRRDTIAGNDLWSPRPDPYPLLVRASSRLEFQDYFAAKGEASSFQDKIQVNMNLMGPGSWFLYLPYWLILLAFVLLWLTLLLARARRRKRIPPAPSLRHP